MKARWIIVVVALAAAAFYFFGPLRSKSSGVRYREAEITRGEIDCRVSATGTLNPVDQVEIGSQVSGTIQRLYVDYNSRVKAGQVLAQIDPAMFRANKSQAEANVDKANVAYLDAERTLGRSKDLMSKGLVAQADVDAAETAYGSRKADLRQAQASLELAEVNLANTTITSPISGFVISRSIDVGQTVAASLQAPKLFVIARDLSEMELEAQVDEADIGQVAVGQPVSFTVDSYPDREFEGHVLQVRAEPIAESGVVSYVTVVRVPNPEGKLLPGMTANVTIVTASAQGVLRIPNAALRYKPKVLAKTADRRTARASQTAQAGGSASADTTQAGAGTGRSRWAASGGQDSMSHGPRGGAGRRGGGGNPGASAPGAARMGGETARADSIGKASTVWVLPPSATVPVPVRIRTGITDGTVTELLAGPLEEGRQVIVGEIETNPKRVGTANPLGGGSPGGAGRGGGGGGGGGARGGGR